MKIFGYPITDPVNLSVKGKFQAILACWFAILMVAFVTEQLITSGHYPFLIASMGASAVILFVIPNSPLAQPWPLLGGQLCSALVGMICALNLGDTVSSASLAVGGSVLLMIALRCLHPPGAATSLAPIMGGDSLTALGYSFILVPVGINVLLMLFFSIAVNRWVLKHAYPSPSPKSEPHHQRHNISKPPHHIGITEGDVEIALREMDVFVDLTRSDLSKVLTYAEMNSFKRVHGDLRCADVMTTDFETVEFGTEIEDAWKIMYQKNLKVMPVVDRAGRIIGIITWHDFFKHLNLSAYESFQDKFRHFVRRTPDIIADKPESVGQIMTSSIVAMEENEHIVELIPLMSIHGHRQIPIVDSKQRLTGMVFQANLIAALYNSTLAKRHTTRRND